MRRFLKLYRDQKLFNQLLLWFLLIALIPFALVTTVIYWRSVEVIEAESRATLLAVAERQARQIERYGDERQKDIAALSHLPVATSLLTTGKGDAAELRTMLRAYRESGVYEDCILIRPDGTIAYSDQQVQIIGANIRASAYAGTQFQKTFERTITLLETEFSDFEYTPETGQAAAYLGAPVFRDGKLAGVILMRVGTREIYRMVNDREGLGQTGETMLARRRPDGVQYVSPLAHDPDSAFRRMADSRGGEMLAAVSGRKGSGTITDYRGVPALAAWWYLPFFRWGVVVKMDLAEAYAPVAGLQLLFTAIGLGTCVAVAFVALRVARSISRPIEELNVAAHAIEGGELSHRIQIDAGSEIGVLARSFNSMAARLQEIIDNLDALVAARTSEVGKKNQDLERTLEELKETQEKLILQEKMASLGGLTAGIAHEIKNPLNFVTNFADLSLELLGELRDELEKRADRLEPAEADLASEILDDLEQNARKINEHGKRADSIVKGMLLHSRGTPGERRPTPLNALLDEYVNLAYHGMRAKDPSFNITIKRDYDAALGNVDVVPQDMGRVFLNMVNNGCYSTREKQRELGNGFSPTVRIQSRDLGAWCEIRIEDNGKGIPPAVVDKVFNPFFTTKPPGEGTGLGLSLSYETVVRGHQGEIHVESEDGQYAAFIIRLPKRMKQIT